MWTTTLPTNTDAVVEDHVVEHAVASRVYETARLACAYSQVCISDPRIG